jgi:hypothetical protein
MISFSESVERCNALTPVVYEFVRNEGKLYEESGPTRQRMEEAILAGKYDIKPFEKEFQTIAGRKEIYEKLAEILDYDEKSEEGTFLLAHRSWIGDQAGSCLEEYYRTELCHYLNVPMIHTDYCAVCKQGMTIEQFNHAYVGGSGGKRYCSEACYDTLFSNCVICGHRNLTCQVNQRTPFISEAKLECACDDCLLKKYNLSLCWIR